MRRGGRGRPPRCGLHFAILSVAERCLAQRKVTLMVLAVQVDLEVSLAMEAGKAESHLPLTLVQLLLRRSRQVLVMVPVGAKESLGIQILPTRHHQSLQVYLHQTLFILITFHHRQNHILMDQNRGTFENSFAIQSEEEHVYLWLTGKIQAEIASG